MQVQIDERLKRSLTIRYWKEGMSVLSKVQAPVISMAENIDPRDMKGRVRGLFQEGPMNIYLEKLWMQTGAIFAMQTDRKVRTRKNIIGKIELKDMEFDFWEDYFRRYYNERSLQKLSLIMDTQAEVVNTIIDNVLQQGVAEGVGIPVLQRRLRDELVEGLTTINKYQAERIARTEVIGSSNKGSFEAADRTGLCTGKAWRTSGLPGIRPSHLYNEGLGEVPMNHVFEGNCKYPGDPEGDASEIINCRCTHIFNVD